MSSVDWEGCFVVGVDFGKSTFVFTLFYASLIRTSSLIFPFLPVYLVVSGIFASFLDEGSIDLLLFYTDFNPLSAVLF